MIRSWYDKASNEKSLRRNSPLPQLLSIPSFCAEWSGSSVTLETTYIQKQHGGCYKITPSFDLFLCARVWLCACVFLALCALWLTLWSPPWEANWFLFKVTKHAHIDPSSIRTNLPLSTVELPWRDWRERGRPRPRSSFTWPGQENGIRKYFILSSPKGLRAESARAFTGRRNSYSGRGEDFFSRHPIFFTETAVTPERKVEKSFPRWQINRHVEG